MNLDFSNEKPIYLQLSEAIEDNILKGVFGEESQVPSTTEVSVSFRINPATAAKGVNRLVDDGIIYKKRGVGMFVCSGAREKITEKRKNSFYEDYVVKMLEEAKKLGIGKQDLIDMIRKND